MIDQSINEDNTSKTLVYVPMIHSPRAGAFSSRLSGLSEDFVNLAYENAMTWAPGFNNIDDYWNGLCRSVETFVVNQRPKVYFEGYSGKTYTFTPRYYSDTLDSWPDEIRSIPEARLVEFLVTRGVTIVHTESESHYQKVGYLVREFTREVGELDRIFQEEDLDTPITTEDWALAYRLETLKMRLEKNTKLRDGYIATQITKTLKPGELGMLFIGAGHDVISRLPSDILIHLLDPVLDEQIKELKGDIDGNDDSEHKPFFREREI